ncbi:MAG TPA: hypothetical protein VNE62_10055, partial [Actinomycetota bacterium]|nr:hypothetical protein [Actinomycetota bacterium]
MTVEPKVLESRGDTAVDPVRLIGPDPSGLAQMLAAVITANLQRQPDLHQRLEGEPGVVSVTASDAGSTVTFELRDGCVRVYSGELTCPADVRVVAD